MPWTKADVDRHKKGLSDKQKERWASTANSVRAQCMKAGGSEKECDAKAVRIANGVVGNMEMISIQTDIQITYTPTTKLWEGREYLVVPVVMMVEGVHNGSHGAIYHDPIELGRIEEAWNGMPVTIYHPKDDTEQFVSANSPEVLDKYAVGRVFNTHLEDGKLKAEAWLDVQRLVAVSPETLDKVRAGEVIEISVGIFSDEDAEEGEWNGEKYVAVAKNYRPDHLALLPGEVGACSIPDGCGVRVNQDKNNVKSKKEEKVMACEKCPEKVDMLIANSATHFDDSDREWLLELSEDKLDKLIPKRVRTNTEEPKKDPPTVDEAKAVIKANVKGDDLLDLLTDEQKANYQEGVKVLKEQRDILVQSVLDNTEKDTWAKDELEKMDIDVLKKLEKSVKKTENTGANYAGMGAGGDTGGEKMKVKPLEVPGVKFEDN